MHVGTCIQRASIKFIHSEMSVDVFWNLQEKGLERDVKIVASGQCCYQTVPVSENTDNFFGRHNGLNSFGEIHLIYVKNSRFDIDRSAIHWGRDRVDQTDSLRKNSDFRSTRKSTLSEKIRLISLVASILVQ